jgi:hypothetical protein
MKNLTRLLLTSLTLGLAAGLSAQTTTGERGSGSRRGPGGPGGHGPGPGGPGMVVRALDVDRDRTISAAEIANAAAAIKTLDTNGDGIVSAAELRPARPPHGKTPPADAPQRTAPDSRPRMIDPIMLALDANGDGALSAAEIAGAPTSLAALDANQDGTLTIDEIRPLPPQ